MLWFFPNEFLPGTVEEDNFRSVAIKKPGFCLGLASVVGVAGTGASLPWVCEVNFDDIFDNQEFLLVVGEANTGAGVPLVKDADDVVWGCDGFG